MIQADGKIILVGAERDPGADARYGRSRFALARYNPDGSLDTSFGGDGKVVGAAWGLNTYLAARIFALVDVWDALRSDCPYRAAWPEEKVHRYLREQAGAHFDPHVVDLFLQGEGAWLAVAQRTWTRHRTLYVS